MGPDDRCEPQGPLVRGGRGAADHAKAKAGSHHQHGFRFGIKVFAPGATVYRATKSAVRALTEGLRVELHSENIRCTMISPGAVATELPESSSEEATRKNLREFYKMVIPADSIARAIIYAIEQTGRGGNRRDRHPAPAQDF